ncbi:MAG: SGNH/GDSL hydrolase family protein [Solirubrobacterales bacterium]
MSFPVFTRFVAIGDSTTEGLDDPYPDGRGYRGWADRLAERLAVLTPDLRYANLAIRGRLIGPIHDTQLQPALAMEPDLASVVGGVNDILRPRVDMDHIREKTEAMHTALISAGATVLSMTLPDLSSSMGVARLVSDRLVAYNELMREVAGRTGAVLVDMADEPVAHDPRLWSSDRLHANSVGHERISIAAAHALGLPDVDYADANAEFPVQPKLPLYRSVPADVAWAWQYFRPWIGRRLRGQSSGDGVEPKRPVLAPVEITG